MRRTGSDASDLQTVPHHRGPFLIDHRCVEIGIIGMCPMQDCSHVRYSAKELEETTPRVHHSGSTVI